MCGLKLRRGRDTGTVLLLQGFRGKRTVNYEATGTVLRLNKHPGQFRFRGGCWFRLSLLHLLALLGRFAVRVGEASHPGPATETSQSSMLDVTRARADGKQCSFSVVVVNPTGFNAKHEVVAQLPAGIYAASETHLTSEGVTRTKQGLRLSSSFDYVAGYPTPVRKRSSVAGSYTGVGFLSTFPCRALSHNWSPELFQTSRIQVAAFFVQPVWITGAVCYGYATETGRSEALLEAVVQRLVLQSEGPRFLAGDFNMLVHEIPQLAVLRQEGFQDVQDVWAVRTGQQPRPTRKSCSRKDFLFLSPEMQNLLFYFELREDWFADHALMRATFAALAAPPPRFIWRMPKRRMGPRMGRSFACAARQAAC